MNMVSLTARIAALALSLSVAGVASAREAAPPASTCNDACLSRLAQTYMDALATHQSAQVPWAGKVRFSENAVPMMIGDGAWGSATAHDARPVILTDTTTGNVGWFGSIEEHGQPAYYAMLLGARGDRIARIETMIRRKEGRPPFADLATYRPDPLLGQTLAAPARSTRERMIGLVQGYFNSIESNDGTVLTRFASNCAHVVNGVAVAQGCEGPIRKGLLKEIEAVRDRAFPVVDEARGVVMAVGYRDLSAASGQFTATDGSSYKGEATYPRSHGFMALFRIEDGAIRRIEEYATELPYLMPAPATE